MVGSIRRDLARRVGAMRTSSDGTVVVPPICCEDIGTDLCKVDGGLQKKYHCKHSRPFVIWPRGWMMS